MFDYVFGSIAYQDILAQERKLSVTLPEDYIAFLLKIGGGVVNKECTKEILLPEINESITIDVLYSLGGANPNADAAYWTEQYKMELMPNTLIFGDDLIQGFLVMICEGERKGVYYWDDAYNFPCSNENCNLYRITETFTEFMKLLINN